MKITWIGQAGLLIETENKKIIIDPYLSDSVMALDPAKHRRVPVLEQLFDIKPDIMLFTHNHLDHYDPETVEKYITKDTCITVLAPARFGTQFERSAATTIMCSSTDTPSGQRAGSAFTP